MKVHESIDIAAKPEHVWPFLVDPQRMADWHAKLEEVRRNGTGPVYVGERFGTTYIMSKKKQNRQDSEAEVLRCEPWTTLVLRHRMQKKGPNRVCGGDVSTVAAGRWRRDARGAHGRFRPGGDAVVGAGADVVHHPIGEPQGEGILEPLKRTCEAGQFAVGFVNAGRFSARSLWAANSAVWPCCRPIFFYMQGDRHERAVELFHGLSSWRAGGRGARSARADEAAYYKACYLQSEERDFAAAATLFEQAATTSSCDEIRRRHAAAGRVPRGAGRGRSGGLDAGGEHRVRAVREHRRPGEDGARNAGPGR